MSQLNHDNVVRIHGMTRISGRSAVLMEYVEGIDAAALATGGDAVGGLPLRVVAQIGELVAAALDAAWHALSPVSGEPLHVVHRDIKPANILVSTGGAVKVMDFGIARAEMDREAETESAQFGTGRYMAPERWLYGQAGPESDVYSLGVTMWELCMGRPMEKLPLDRGAFEQGLQERLAALAGPLGSEGAGLLVDVLRDMLAFEPRERCTAARLVEDMNRLADVVQGSGLRRFARLEVRPLMEARLHQLRNHPVAQDLTGTVYTGKARNSKDTLAGLYLPEKTAVHPSRGATATDTAGGVDPQARPGLSSRSPGVMWGLGLSGVVAGLVLVWWIGAGQGSKSRANAVAPAVTEILEGSSPSGPGAETRSEPKAPDGAGPDTPQLPARRSSSDRASARPAISPATEAGPVPRVISAPATSANPERPAHHEPHVVVIDERSGRAAVPPREDASSVQVTVKILADPRAGTLKMGEYTAQVGDLLTVPVGVYQARFEGLGWRTTCQVALTVTSTKIKFEQKGSRCLPQ